ncbi:hypothetical protein Syun_028345 [Stephania yunnanensis]|uniref:pyruvate dehydrogenase (acetyl-transferring) n=1 Tax=Stephania yunnanensis TaxID=152371 RepID=A0AAP0HNQ1_9MAGN
MFIVEAMNMDFLDFNQISNNCGMLHYNAKGLLKAAIRREYPVILFEHVLLYNLKKRIPNEENISTNAPALFDYMSTNDLLSNCKQGKRRVKTGKVY